MDVTKEDIVILLAFPVVLAVFYIIGLLLRLPEGIDMIPIL